MAILDYSGILNRGVSGAGQTALQTQGDLQGLALNNQRLEQNDFNMQQQEQQVEAQQQQLIKNQQLDAEAAGIYKSGDMNAIADFSLKNPERAKGILAAKGIVDDAGVKRVSDRFSNILTSSNPLETLNSEIAKGEAAGLDMTQSKQILSQNLPPEEIKKAAGMALASVDGGRFKSIQEAYSSGGKPMTEYQREMVKGSAIDRELRKSEIENKKIDNQLKTETNAVKLNELKAKSIANEEKQFQIKKARSDSAQTVVDSGNSTLELIGEIEKHPGFESAIGAKGASSLFGALDEPFSGSEAAGVGALIETLEAQNFLTAIGEFKSAGGAGSLSDNEGKKLGAALSNLTSSQSEVDFKKSLNVIRNLVKKQVSKARPQIEKRFKLEPSASNQKNNEVDLSKLSLEELKALRAKD